MAYLNSSSFQDIVFTANLLKCDIPDEGIL